MQCQKRRYWDKVLDETLLLTLLTYVCTFISLSSFNGSDRKVFQYVTASIPISKLCNWTVVSRKLMLENVSKQ